MPVFILTPARSGSTLLRRIIAGHPEIACPPETNVVLVMANLIQSVHALEPRNFDPVPFLEGDTPSPLASKMAGEIADSILGGYARANGKREWCDKSLSNIEHAELLASLLPSVKFICLVRNWMDFVHSAIESSPWSYTSYGFQNFVLADPLNPLIALSRYWSTRATHHRVREANVGPINGRSIRRSSY